MHPRRSLLLFAALIVLGVGALILIFSGQRDTDNNPMTDSDSDSSALEIATVGGGCFWCTEAVMERLPGVTDVVSGYMGGHVSEPTYEQVCTKTTGHAEVIQVHFDPSQISYQEILEVFWQAHDPTTLDRQGADSGSQYRSVIFAHSDEQKQVAEESKAALDASGAYDSPAVTEITAASDFWEAEKEHQDFYRLNPNFGYCRAVIHPKLQKLKMVE
jgi:peptide-methionine (S)-S-oxide reductase